MAACFGWGLAADHHLHATKNATHKPHQHFAPRSCLYAAADSDEDLCHTGVPHHRGVCPRGARGSEARARAPRWASYSTQLRG